MPTDAWARADWLNTSSKSLVLTMVEPGERIRTRISSSDQSLNFEVALTDPRCAVKRVRIAYELPGENGRTEEVEFTLESEDLPDT